MNVCCTFKKSFTFFIFGFSVTLILFLTPISHYIAFKSFFFYYFGDGVGGGCLKESFYTTFSPSKLSQGRLT